MGIKLHLSVGVPVLVVLFVVQLNFLVVFKWTESGITDRSMFEIRKIRSPEQTLNKIPKNPNTWTILLTVNDAFFDFFQNWLWYYKKLDLHLPIIIIAEDEKAYKKLKSACNECFVLRSDLNIKGAQNYSSELYKVLVSKRPQYILQLLRKGHDIIYADIDSVWLRNPIPFINKTVDFGIQPDGYGSLCTGFMVIRSNERTIDIIQQWHDHLIKQPKINQRTFNNVMRSNKVRRASLNSKYFPSGQEFFDRYSDKKRRRVVVVHNNWIVGHDAKKMRFQNFSLWQVPSD